MAAKVTQMFGIEYPVFAFTHCRDVVVAMSKAGGLGVLGAALHSDERLEMDLQWIDEQLGNLPYGVDLMMPANYVGAEKGGLDQQSLKALIPDEHKRFLDTLLAEAGVPELAEQLTSPKKERGLRFSQKQAKGIVDIAFAHHPKFLVSALGTPPDWVMRRRMRVVYTWEPSSANESMRNGIKLLVWMLLLLNRTKPVAIRVI
jgi:NAD(P)H-dependent flavin oxidoreductase YrpB (nitropropane dioxygenase family)